MKRTLAAAVWAAFAAALPARADDSSATLAAGSIQFAQSAAIRMVSEDLRISPKKVRIRFVFENTGNRDIETLVAFPLPDIDENEFFGSPVGLVTDDPENFVGFTVVADGKRVSPKVEQKAILRGHDVTAQIRAARAPLNLITAKGYEQLDRLPRAGRGALLAAHIVEDGGDGTLVPMWTLKTRFYWMQRFPAHKKVVIEHSYQPVTGQTFASVEEFNGSQKDIYGDYCIDPPTRSRLMAKFAPPPANARRRDAGGLLVVYRTDYILYTAKNWSGPIGTFRLTLDKLKPANVLSLCWDGALKKRGTTTFEFTAKDFVPRHDIRLIVFE